MRREEYNKLGRRIDVIYNIYEVYYDKRGKVDGWTEVACHPQGEDSLKSLKLDFRLMALAFKRPVLDYNSGVEYHAQTAQTKKALLSTVQASQNGVGNALAKGRRAKPARSRTRNERSAKR